MSKAKGFYNIDNLIKTGATYLIPFGQRSNGKSYQGRGYALKNTLQNERFVYLRRWKDDIKAKEVERWFDKKQTQSIIGNYEIVARQNEIYTATRDSKGMVKLNKPIGYYLALNEAERYKSWVFEDVTTIIYEEFITNRTYLDDEPSKLMQLISTIARLDKVKVILIGNTISRLCPYFAEWSLDGIFRQKIGTIEIYHQHLENGDVVDIAVENCNVVEYKNTMYFGNTAKQIVSGEWETYEMPKRPKVDFETIYEILVEYQKFRFVMQLQVNDDGEVITYIYRHTKNRHIDRIITDRFDTSPLVNNRLNTDKRAEELIQWCFRNNKVCYSDNLTGTDFKHVKDAFRFV